MLLQLTPNLLSQIELKLVENGESIVVHLYVLEQQSVPLFWLVDHWMRCYHTH